MKKLFQDNKGTIHDRINHYKSSAVEYDDLVCVANMAFVEAYQSWDSKKSAFNTHLYNTLNIKLFNYVRKEKTRFYREMDADSFMFESIPCHPTFEPMTVPSLPDDSKEIIKVIFDASVPIENKTNKISKHTIYNYFRAEGWAHSKIIKGMQAIEREIHTGGLC